MQIFELPDGFNMIGFGPLQYTTDSKKHKKMMVLAEKIKPTNTTAFNTPLLEQKTTVYAFLTFEVRSKLYIHPNMEKIHEMGDPLIVDITISSGLHQPEEEGYTNTNISKVQEYFDYMIWYPRYQVTDDRIASLTDTLEPSDLNPNFEKVNEVDYSNIYNDLNDSEEA